MARVSEGVEYARQVVEGEIDVCRWVGLACRRFFTDLEKGADFPYRFDEEQAQIVLDAFALCRHTKGNYAGQVFEPSPWETFIVSQLFGWIHRLTGLRKYRIAYIECPRKNGKTALLAVVGIYMAFLDGEPGAEVYSCATKRDQAKILHTQAKQMVRGSPPLAMRVEILRDNMTVERLNSKFEPLGSDADTLDGLNSHCNLVDELHAHRDRQLWDVLETGIGGRLQPFQIAISTAGYRQQSICFEQRTYLTKVLEGVIDDPSYWGIIYTIDPEDDWKDEKSWIKANPGWGVSVQPDDMRRAAQKAMEVPEAQNAFLTKRLNVWTNQVIRWISIDKWNQCGGPIRVEELIGQPCYGGLDLSTKIDLTAFVLVFPLRNSQKWAVLSHFWIPSENMQERAHRDKVPYDTWAREGWIEVTDGNMVDYTVIKKRIGDLSKKFSIQEIGFDPYNAAQLTIELQEDFGLRMVEMRQGVKTMSEPSKHLEALVLSRNLMHGDNPVLKWCASNVAVRKDPNENYMPDKAKSQERIDGITALVMAIGRGLAYADAASVYEDRGLLVL